jgi:hypothetical protein
MATATLKFVPTTIYGSSFGSTDEETVTYSGTLAFSAAADVYLTGGIAPLAGFALKNLGPFADRTPLAVFIFSRNGSGWNYQWNLTTGKLQIYGSAAGSGTSADPEVTNNTALSGLTGNGGLTVFTDVIGFQATFPRI